MAILVAFLLTQGIMPSLYWLELIYYLFAAICLTISLAMITSVLNMLARDTRKLILACMRLLLYLKQMLFFWVFVIVIFTIGSMMMYKFKHKFIDMI